MCVKREHVINALCALLITVHALDCNFINNSILALSPSEDVYAFPDQHKTLVGNASVEEKDTYEMENYYENLSIRERMSCVT